MGTQQKQPERIRLSLDVSEELNRTLDQLASSTGGSKSDVLRRAIALMDVAVSAKQKGNSMGVVDQNDLLIHKIIGL